MSNKSIWEILDLHVTTDQKEIKKAYAKKTKVIHPEDHPEEFMELHEAYEKALHFAKHQKNITITRNQPSDSILQKDESPNYDVTVAKEANTQEQKTDSPYSYDFTKAEKLAEESPKTSTTQTQANQKTQQTQTQTQAETMQESATRQAFAYTFLYQEAIKKQAKEKERKHQTVLQELLRQMKRTPFHKKEWKTYIESDEFQSISEDPAFLKALLEVLKNTEKIPYYCFLTLSSYYRYAEGTSDNSQTLKDLLVYLDHTFPEFEAKHAKDQKKKLYLISVVTLLTCILIAYLTHSPSYLVGALPIGLAAFIFTYIQTFPNSHKPNAKQLFSLLLVIFASVSITVALITQTVYDPKEDAIQYVKETYLEDFPYRDKISNASDNQNVRIYQFEDPEHNFMFEVKASNSKDDVWKFEDNYAFSFVSHALRKDEIRYHEDNSSLKSNSKFVKKTGFDLQIQADSDVNALAKLLYETQKTLVEKEISPQCRDYTFYVIPEYTSFTRSIPASFTMEDLTTMSEEEIYDMLQQAYVNYQIEYTLNGMDEQDPYVKQYYANASGIDIKENGQEYHFDDIHIKDGNITLGNFYRLAKHMNWNIKVMDKDSFSWEFHGRVEIFGSGSVTPYIEYTRLKAFLLTESF